MALLALQASMLAALSPDPSTEADGHARHLKFGSYVPPPQPAPSPTTPPPTTVRFDGPAPAADEVTDVLVLGAGMSGLAAARQLFDADVEFVVLEGSDRVGGRMRKAELGTRTVEVGAQWITRPLGRTGYGDNPMWQLAEQVGLETARTAFDYGQSYYAADGTDVSNDATFLERRAAMTAASECDWANREAIIESLRAGEAVPPDVSQRETLAACGWTPATPMDSALEWITVDYGWATNAGEVSSETWDYTYLTYGPGWGWVSDQRGFVTLAEEVAKPFIGTGCGGGEDPAACVTDHLRLSERVISVARPPTGGVVVTVERFDGTLKTYGARYAISSFSVGVLRHALFDDDVPVPATAGPKVDFAPPLPKWKSDLVGDFRMGHYCKLFLEFDAPFWDSEAWVYASEGPVGQWPLWQTMKDTWSGNSVPGFDGAHVIMGTNTESQCVLVATRTDEEVVADAMELLRNIFPGAPEPTAWYVTRWPTDEWTYGSYPYWPVGTLTWKSRALEYPVDQLFFTGDATNGRFPSYTHGAYMAGLHTSALVLACLGKPATFPRDPEEAAWKSFAGIACPEQSYDAAAVQASFHTEPVTRDQSDGNFYSVFPDGDGPNDEFPYGYWSYYAAFEP